MSKQSPPRNSASFVIHANGSGGLLNWLGLLMGVVLSLSPVMPLQAEDSVLLHRTTDNKWFTYVLGSAGLVEKGFMPFTRSPAYSVVSRGDFDGDGQFDLLVRDLSAGRDENGRWVMYTINGTEVTSQGYVDGFTRSSDWELKATADFNGDLRADLLLRNSIDGRWLMYAMDGRAVVAQGVVAMSQQLSDQFQGVADFNGDGRSEVLLRRSDGSWLMYTLNGLSVESTNSPAFSGNPLFTLQALADFNADGKDDVLLRRNDGRWFMYLMNGADVFQQGAPALTEATTFGLEAVADFNADGASDILVRRNTDGRWFLYLMSGISVSAGAAPDMTKNLLFNIVKTSDFTGDGKADLLMRRADGRWVLYAMNGVEVSLKIIPDMTRNLAWQVKEFPPAIVYWPGSDAHLY
ncbi:MAG: VCBS repeat-containing protein, partial [Chromatiales bacterium]|nr:VCBS repeat-containing protein [Chromatiales bacterium]